MLITEVDPMEKLYLTKNSSDFNNFSNNLILNDSKTLSSKCMNSKTNFFIHENY